MTSDPLDGLVDHFSENAHHEKKPRPAPAPDLRALVDRYGAAEAALEGAERDADVSADSGQDRPSHFRCLKCGSTPTGWGDFDEGHHVGCDGELRPSAVVDALNARDTAKAALLAAIDRALGRTAGSQAERVPCAGWVRVAPNRWHLTVGHLRATVYVSTTGVSWRVAVMLDGEHILSSSEVDDHTATSVAPAQLAAEDAIAELCTAGLRAIGR